jgi:hypothetical protein
MDKYKFEPGYWIKEGEIDDPLEGELISAGGRFVLSPDGTYIEFPYCAHGDYLGSMVERSNYEYIVEYYKDIVVRDSASYAYRNIYVREDILEKNRELKTIFEGLENYPLIDEERYSQLQMDVLEEDWDAWIKFDLIHELDLQGYNTDDEEAIHEVYKEIMFKESIYYWDENPYSMSIKIDDILEHCSDYCRRLLWNL